MLEISADDKVVGGGAQIECIEKISQLLNLIARFFLGRRFGLLPPLPRHQLIIHHEYTLATGARVARWILALELNAFGVEISADDKVVGGGAQIECIEKISQLLNLIARFFLGRRFGLLPPLPRHQLIIHHEYTLATGRQKSFIV